MATLAITDLADGPCPYCAPRLDGCDDCGEAIQVYENMGGAGYQSPRPTHYHLGVLHGMTAKEPVYAELCLECYRKTFASEYGDDTPCPV